jgi:hypothetical protein
MIVLVSTVGALQRKKAEIPTNNAARMCRLLRGPLIIAFPFHRLNDVNQAVQRSVQNMPITIAILMVVAVLPEYPHEFSA